MWDKHRINNDRVPQCKTLGWGRQVCYRSENNHQTATRRNNNRNIWNVGSLHACGKIQELTYELKRYRWDILGLVDVRWTGFGETTTDQGHETWYWAEV